MNNKKENGENASVYKALTESKTKMQRNLELYIWSLKIGPHGLKNKRIKKTYSSEMERKYVKGRIETDLKYLSICSVLPGVRCGFSKQQKLSQVADMKGGLWGHFPFVASELKPFP